MYFDDILYIGEDAYGPINMLERFFRLKEESLGLPDRCLGKNVDII